MLTTVVVAFKMPSSPVPLLADSRAVLQDEPGSSLCDSLADRAVSAHLAHLRRLLCLNHVRPRLCAWAHRTPRVRFAYEYTVSRQSQSIPDKTRP